MRQGVIHLRCGERKNTAVIKGHSQLLTHREYLCCNLHDTGVDVHCIVGKSKCFFFLFWYFNGIIVIPVIKY